jgi:hypothetical protein
MSILGRSPAALTQAATDFSGSGLIGGAGLACAFGISVIWWNWAAAPVYIVVGVTIAVLLRKMRVCGELVLKPRQGGDTGFDSNYASGRNADLHIDGYLFYRNR